MSRKSDILITVYFVASLSLNWTSLDTRRSRKQRLCLKTLHEVTQGDTNQERNTTNTLTRPHKTHTRDFNTSAQTRTTDRDVSTSFPLYVTRLLFAIIAIVVCARDRALIRGLRSKQNIRSTACRPVSTLYAQTKAPCLDFPPTPFQDKTRQIFVVC